MVGDSRGWWKILENIGKQQKTAGDKGGQQGRVGDGGGQHNVVRPPPGPRRMDCPITNTAAPSCPAVPSSHTCPRKEVPANWGSLFCMSALTCTDVLPYIFLISVCGYLLPGTSMLLVNLLSFGRSCLS